MGAIGKLISTKFENYVTAIIQKKLGQNIDGAFYSPSGDDSPPLPNDKTFMSRVDGSEKMAFLGTLMITQGAENGEKILYSRDSSGAIKAKIYIKKDGTIEITTIGGLKIDGIDFKNHIHPPGTYSNSGGPVVGLSGGAQ